MRIRGFKSCNGMALTLLLLYGTPLWSASQPVPMGPDQVFIQSTDDDEIKIMSYNLLNLFDAEKDPEADDWLWLPRDTPGRADYCSRRPGVKEQNYCHEFDWTYEKVDLKLKQIKKVVTFQGSAPDFLAVMEVESTKVLALLADKLGYKNFIITESHDARGIDVALLFNLKEGLSFEGQSSIPVYFKSKRKGRDILRVDFNWNGQIFSIYVNHWPSQRNPSNERYSSAESLAADIDQQIRVHGAKWTALAIGDFNTIETDTPHPFHDFLQNANRPHALFDIENYARQSQTNPSWPYTPPTAYYYFSEDTWSKLDRAVATPNLIDGEGLELVQDSFRIPFPEFMTTVRKKRNFDDSKSIHTADRLLQEDHVDPSSETDQNTTLLRIPRKYNFDTLDEAVRGFSDHLPLIFKLKNSP